MLNSLSIQNFALIEDVELNLKGNLTIITGETGAGKSILLGALSLLLGKRADLSSLKNPAQKCVIEGTFSIANYGLEPLFDELDLDYDEQSIVRREILPSGKSRAFVNDTPVLLAQLNGLGEHLVDIHSQHETLSVGDPDYQYRVIDAMAGNEELLVTYSRQLKAYRKLNKKLEKLRAEQAEAQKTYDYHLFLWNELRESNLKPGMQEELEEKQQELSHVEELKESLALGLQNLEQEEIGINARLQEIKSRFQRLKRFGKRYEDIEQRLTSVIVELDDIGAEMESLAQHIEDDPEHLEQINEQLQNLYNLQNKHQVASVEELIELQSELKEKIAVAENASQNTENLQKEIAQARQELEKQGAQLTRQRKEVVPQFTASVKNALSKLGMPHAELKVDFETVDKFTPYGTADMSWLFSANKGGRLQAIKKSASGGELSRLALVIKSILASFSNLPTLIFDEIDTGVSGEIAQKMGEIMHEMGTTMQVLSITHLPQIAAKGNHHFKVYKQVQGNDTQTIITELGHAERVRELAEMLGGKELSDSAIAHAKSLLN